MRKVKTGITDVHPRKEWKSVLKSLKLDVVEYRNLQHFKQDMKKITQRQDNNCGVSYAEALDDLLKGRPLMSQGEYEIIKNKVMNNLQKRQLISDVIYDSYKYDVQGDIVDVAKVIEGDPYCCLVPANPTMQYFYELYINISYPGHISDKEVREGMAKILATIELLESKNIFTKVTLVDCSGRVAEGTDLLTILPLFSHRDQKSIETMSSVLNERLLRKFMFALSEDLYKENLNSSYGAALALPKSIRPYNVNEEELCSSILEQIIVPGTR